MNLIKLVFIAASFISPQLFTVLIRAHVIEENMDVYDAQTNLGNRQDPKFIDKPTSKKNFLEMYDEMYDETPESEDYDEIAESKDNEELPPTSDKTVSKGRRPDIFSDSSPSSANPVSSPTQDNGNSFHP